MSTKQFRQATRNDIPLILKFIKDLAHFEKLEHEVTATPEIYGAYGHKAQYGDFDAYGHDEQISSSMVKGYAKQVSAHTAISAGAGTGPYEPAHQGHDFSDFSTADGSKIEGEIKVPVTSQKQAESERLAQQAAAVQALRCQTYGSLLHPDGPAPVPS